MNTCRCGNGCAPGRKHCEACLGAFRLKNKLWAQKQCDLGLCHRCTRPATHGRFCEGHHAYDVAHRHPTGRPVGRQRQERGDRFAAAFAEGKRPGQIALDHGVKVSLVTCALIARGVYEPRRIGRR